jgi:hypothetical protein
MRVITMRPRNEVTDSQSDWLRRFLELDADDAESIEDEEGEDADELDELDEEDEDDDDDEAEGGPEGVQ